MFTRSAVYFKFFNMSDPLLHLTATVNRKMTLIAEGRYMYDLPPLGGGTRVWWGQFNATC